MPRNTAPREKVLPIVSGAQGIQAGVLSLEYDLCSDNSKSLGHLNVAGERVEILLGVSSLWAVMFDAQGRGFALRCAWCPDGALQAEAHQHGQIRLSSALGQYDVCVAAPVRDAKMIRVTTKFTPVKDLLVPFWPRDLYPLGPKRDPSTARGTVLAAQRGFNTALVFGRLEDRDDASFLYLQNLTALNAFFRMTDTKPDGVVGGVWPELGYQPPPVCAKPLCGGREITISDAFLRLDGPVRKDKQAEGRVFLEHLAAIYPCLETPDVEMRDWPTKAERSIHDLTNSPLVAIEDGGQRFLRGYVDGGHPDSMAQLSVLGMVDEYQEWLGAKVPLRDELRAGIYRFFDPELSSLVGYLASRPPEKDVGQVDSWYLYHPLKGLARLARSGDAGARDLFLSSLGHATAVARHFDYDFPIKFDVRSLLITTKERKPGSPGQTDTAGLYAYVMMEAFDLTGDKKYLEEAKAAIRATTHLGFDLAYQTNLTSWGAAACVRIWKETRDSFFLNQSYPFLASFFHNCVMWQSDLGRLAMTATFLGVTCLHDGPYMAPFECYESFCAFAACLEMAHAEPEFSDAARLLMAEFCRFALERAWWFYPSCLPETCLAHSPQNGKIMRELELPVEDLYVDGEPVGQIGQEVYGAGAALAYATRAFHRLPDDRLLFCSYPAHVEICGSAVELTAYGPEGGLCEARLLPADGAKVRMKSKSLDPNAFRPKVGEVVKISY